LHGGGYVLGSLATGRPLASRVAHAAEARILNVEYRLAPEHPFPAALHDSVTAYTGLLHEGVDPATIAVLGDSAGGGLAVATLVAARDQGLPLPAAGVCISPWVDLTLSNSSLFTNDGRDPQINRHLLAEMAAAYLQGQEPTLPLASPAYADLSGLPPLLIHAGTAEVLFDDARMLAVAANNAGVEVTLELYEHMIHVWHAYAPGLPEGGAAIDRIASWLADRWTPLQN
jgi:acetyl esterase/lipase